MDIIGGQFQEKLNKCLIKKPVCKIFYIAPGVWVQNFKRLALGVSRDTLMSELFFSFTDTDLQVMCQDGEGGGGQPAVTP